jgi:HPr kinase/phosphorylase
MYTVALSQIFTKMKLKNLTPSISLDEIEINQSDVNRPALQLTGFFDYFDSERVQIIGKVEYTYMEKMTDRYRTQVLETLFKSKIPCLIFCKGLEPKEEVINMAIKYKIPLLLSYKTTSSFMAELIRYLKSELAPRMSVHGVLVDVYGEGVLITGESGIGKSEAALELIKRGHRLVADDVVEIKKVSDDTLIGSSPEIIRHLIELRGIGIIDVRTLFGIESVKEIQNINLVIKLEEWDPNKEYAHLGLDEGHMDFLGNKVVSHTIPIGPGRNLAVIVESAAVNYRQKIMGYHTTL